MSHLWLPTPGCTKLYRKKEWLNLQVAVTVHVAMTAYQSVIYDWVKATGTLRLSPFDPRLHKSHRHNFAPLNNKCMELRKVSLCCTVVEQHCLQHPFWESGVVLVPAG